MSNWAIFLTATQAPPKALNRALLLAHDFEFGSYPPDFGWILLSSKTLPTKAKARKPTRLPITPPISASAFAGWSLAAVNAFVRKNSKALAKLDISAADWAVLDQRGLETSTCIVCEQYYDSEADGDGTGDGDGGMTDEFRACRLPYEEAHGMISNLDISNMGFEDFVDQERGEQDDGCWMWRSFVPSDEPEAEEKDEEDGEGDEADAEGENEEENEEEGNEEEGEGEGEDEDEGEDENEDEAEGEDADEDAEADDDEGEKEGEEEQEAEEADGPGISRQAVYEMLKAGNHVD